MSSLSLRLPESLHKCLRDLAARDNVSINQFITTAVAEKITALETEDYINIRAERGSLDDFRAVLDKVRDSEPDASDL
ncbi:MAG: toxin-antitoxin system HicB family antitoxin [Spirochaetales bacterium]|nr:toxin-antitoxin system HicB family antitoxin [Spirochaetales bacterium]